jgi:hypothetical protein
MSDNRFPSSNAFSLRNGCLVTSSLRPLSIAMDTLWEGYEHGLAKVQKGTDLPEFKIICIDINKRRWLFSEDFTFQVVHSLTVVDVD